MIPGLFDHQSITQAVAHFTLLGNNSPWASGISAHLVSKALITLGARLSFPEYLCTEWPQKVEMLSPSEQRAGRLTTIMQELASLSCVQLSLGLCRPVGLGLGEPAREILKQGLLLLL